MPLPRFCELIRVSSSGQAARDTPEDQRRALDRLRASRPGRLVERIEQQVSGAAAGDARPDLARLAELAALRAFDEVRVRHLDRLTRHEDPLERAAVLSMVRRAGAVIVDAAGAVLDPATMGGELVWVVSTLASAEERRKILDRTMAAKRRLAAEGRLVSSAPPWGRAWDRDRGWSLTPAARDYRRLFELAGAGHSLWTIARRLTDEGIASARGRPWTAQMVRNLLHARHASGRWRSHGAEAPIPAIVSEEVQAAALARLAEHDHAGGRHATHPALLRKVLRCGVCGISCHTNRNTGGELYYHCAARSPACYHAHNTAAVDDAVRARLGAWLRQRGALAVAEGQDATGDEVALQRAAKEAQRELAKVAAEEDRVADMARQGFSPRAVSVQMGKVRRARAAAEEQRRQAAAALAAFRRRAELATDLAARIEEIRRGVARGGFAEWREAVEILFPGEGGYHVAIWPDGRLRLHAAVSLDATGETALRQAGRGKRASPSRGPCRIPVLLVARMG